MSRGCGSRQENGLYCCVESSPYGQPIEYFVVDPALPFDIPKSDNMRSPYLYPDPEGVYHLIMGVGNMYYPFVSDYIEETKRMGISKRLPRNFDYRKLDPKKSNLILVHKRAIPDFSYHINAEDYYNCPRIISGRHIGDDDNPTYMDDLAEVTMNGKTVKTARHQCIGDNWALSSALHVDEKHELEEEGDIITVTTPSASYTVDPAFTMKDGDRLSWDNSQYQTGIFMRFPQFHFEYVRAKPKQHPEEERNYEMALTKLQEVYVDKGFGFRVMEE